MKFANIFSNEKFLLYVHYIKAANLVSDAPLHTLMHNGNFCVTCGHVLALSVVDGQYLH